MLNLIAEILGSAVVNLKSRAGSPFVRKGGFRHFGKGGGPRREEAQKAHERSPPSRKRQLPLLPLQPVIPGTAHILRFLGCMPSPGGTLLPHLPTPPPPGQLSGLYCRQVCSRGCSLGHLAAPGAACAAMEMGPRVGGEQAVSQRFVDSGEGKTGASGLSG